jgi:hypothetical protein
LIAVLALVAGAVAAASYLIRPEKARAFDLFHGSIFLSYKSAPVAVDLPTGKPTLGLAGADQQVSLGQGQSLGVVPLLDHTLLLNQSTGEFNMIDNSGFLVKHDGSGVGLPTPAGSTSAVGLEATNGQAYIVLTGDIGGTDVYLVGQPTVEAAINAPPPARPPARASGSMLGTVSTAAGTAASANGDLWLLVGPPEGERTIRQMRVPPGSSTGATLIPSDRNDVNGVAAIGTATTGEDGSGSTTVGVASLSRIDVFPARGAAKILTYQAPDGVDRILPSSNGQGRLAFLLHATAGWYLLSINAEGNDLRGPVPLHGLPAGSLPAEPAAAGNGRLYTIDRHSGRLFQIGYDGTAQAVPGGARYPIPVVRTEAAESNDFGDAYVIARGPRVIFNSASHADALMVFTDGSQPPRTISKNSAVLVNAAGGAEALTRSAVPPGQRSGRTHGPPHTKPVPAQPVNPKIDCHTVTQKPHIPVITNATTGSRSVTLTWSYPIIDQVQDCYPSTYQVSFERLSNDAPPPPKPVTIQSQTGATIGGLFPSTKYDVTVTAYLHGLGTPSESKTIITTPEGPAAPENLSVTADPAGNWRLSWDSCGTVEQGCVAAVSWTVTPNFCDGRGVSSPPPAISITADPTSKHQPPAVYKGTEDLLGRGLQFQVQGTADQGQPGTPSARSGCVYSWSPPVASLMSLKASTAPVTQLGQPTTATVTLDLGAHPVRAAGGVGATFTYQLLSGGSVLKSIGPTGKTSVKFDAIRAGVAYQARAIVAAPRHPSINAVVGPIDVETAHAPWPTITVTADQPVNQGAVRATVTVHIGGLTSADADGEKFDLTSESGIYCGNTNQLGGWDRTTAIDPADPLTFTVDRTQMFGDGCIVKVQLVQDEAFGTAVFGAGTSSNAATSAPFTIDAPELVGVASSDFTARWDGVSSEGRSQIAVNYVGGNPLVGLFVHSWSLSVTVNDPAITDPCGGYQDHNSLDDVSVSQACVDAAGASGQKWHVAVSFKYLGSTQGPFDVSPVDGGQAPTYNPPQCDVARAGLAATWDGTTTTPAVSIDAARQAPIADCSNWAYTVVGPTTPVCGTGAGPPPQTIQLTCTDAPATTGWSVTVTYNDENGNAASPVTLTIDGALPP